MIMKSVFIFLTFFVTPEGEPGAFVRLVPDQATCNLMQAEIKSLSEQTGMPSATMCIKSPEFRSNERSAGTKSEGREAMDERQQRIEETANLIKELHSND